MNVRVLAAFVAIAIASLVPRAAFAQDRRIEASAKEAIKRARADFSAADFDGALARLLKATRACGTIRCSAPTRAALLRDAGVMQLRRGATAKAQASFAEALRVDKRIELAAPYDVPDIRAAWNAVLDTGSVESAPQPSGDFSHTPVPEQAVRTPVPIYVEYGGGDSVASVVAKYKGPADADWKRVSLVRAGKGWGGLVPCADVKEGVLRYYVQGFDAGGTPNALSGDPKHPYHVAIRRSLVGPPPSLPGQPPPVTCTGREEGGPPIPAEAPPSIEPAQCIDDSQCNGGVCNDGRCAAPTAQQEETKTNYARIWVGVSVSVDLASLPGGSDVCKLTPNGFPATSSYYCTNPDGSDYPTRRTVGENNTLAAGNAGQASGGPAIGNARLLASIDYALSSNILVGARFGAVVHAYPGSAAGNDGKGFRRPIHLELRGTYVFGANALAHSGFAPLVFVDAGIGEFDAGQTVTVSPTNVPGQLPKNAWVTSGPGFVGLGAGVRYGFSQRIAFNAALKVAGAFGGNGFFPMIAPELALQYGF